MEWIQGKHTRPLAAEELAARLAGCPEVLFDLGAGDGRFVLHAARAEPRLFAVGLDASRDNLRASSRSAPGNALFVIANALELPPGLSNLADRLTINFPWGSLLEGLLNADPALLSALYRLARPRARLDVRLNASALAEAGRTLEEGGWLVSRALETAGFQVRSPRPLDAAALRALPSTWARRMAYSRRPEGVWIRAAVKKSGPVPAGTLEPGFVQNM